MVSLSDHYRDTLQEFIDDGPKCFTKLYSAAENGCSAAVFHQRCDNRGPTVTVVYNTEGHVYGGYTSVSWLSASIKQVYDETAFLFCLKGIGQEQVERKFPIRKSESALVYDGQLGPTFGSGPDLGLFTGTIDKEDDGTFPLNVQLSAGSFDHMPLSLMDQISTDVTVEDIVVYGVQDLKPNVMSLPWRDEPKFNS